MNKEHKYMQGNCKDITSDELDLTKPLDPKKISDESAIKLAAAILESAADDYRKALVKENALRRYMHSNGSKKYIEYIYVKGELEMLRKFFRSQWCGTLLGPTKLDGEDVIKKIEKEVLGKRRF